jgi:hypothetical protein
MAVGELVVASVVDHRVWSAEGERGAPGIYLAGVPGRAFPFTMYRAWKIGTGMVSEEVRFYGPSGRMAYRWGPHARHMLGSMDLTIETDLVEDGRFEETGMHLASFIVDGDVVAELEVPVYLQQAPAKLAKEVEDGLKKSDVIWIASGRGAGRRSAPAWFSYRNGRIYVLSSREPGAEQSIPGIPGVEEVTIVTRRKGRDTSLGEFAAAVRILEGAEWDEAAKALADRRRSRVGAPGESIARWRGACAIAELTPIV